MVSSRIVCRRFIGRAEELEHLEQRRRLAAEGHGGLVLVGGEAGIGKSRLVSEFKTRLNRRTSIVAAGACREFAQKPLGPILEILQQIGGANADQLSWSSKSERLDGVAGIFERVAAKRATVVILEDLHWADIDLVQTLLVLVRRAANKRLFFVATYRDNELSPSHPLFKWFGQLLREPAASAIVLTRMQERDLDRLMAFALEGSVELSPPVLRAVRDRSDGNPLFTEELLRSTVDSHRNGRSSPPALPLSLHALIGERLQECSPEERSFLRHASLFGRTIDIGQICEIFDGSVETLQSTVDRLSELQMIDAVETIGGVYRFRHALTREVVYGEMPREVVSPLHATIAEHLESLPPATQTPEILAYHFWEAGLVERAAAYYERAGDAAMDVFAYDDAAGFYRRAATGLESDAAACARVCGLAARAQIFAGDLDTGLILYERAVAIALQLGDVTEVVRSRALMAGHLFDAGRCEEAIALLQATLPIGERARPSLSSRIQTRLAMMLVRDGRLDEATTVLQKIRPAELDPNAESTGEYYLCASELGAYRGQLEQWRAFFDRGVGIYQARAHPGPLQVAHANFAVQALSLGETDLARRHHVMAGELARTLHFDDQAVFQAQIELYVGNLVEARRIIEGAPTSARFLMRAMQAQVALPLAIALGDERMLEAFFDESLVAEAPQPFTATLARVAAANAMALAAINRHDEARVLLARVLESLDTAFGMVLPIVAIATFLPERAHELRTLLENDADSSGNRLAKALRALVAGDGIEGARRFEEIGWPLHQAHCLEMAGDHHAAVAIYRRCGAAGEVRRVELESIASKSAAPLGVLTVRERELVLQVAAGKPNRAIADALSIGEKTVEKYLTSIYAKLGLTSRTQLAALVAASRGPTDARSRTELHDSVAGVIGNPQSTSGALRNVRR